MYKLILIMVLLLINTTSTKAQYNLEAGIWDTAWNPDGTLLAVANPAGQIYVYDTAGELLHTFSGHNQRTTSVSWSPNGEILASGGYDTFIRFWNIDTGELAHEMNIFVEPTSDIEWQSNGTYLAIASFDTIRIWDTVIYEPITWGVAGNVLDIEWSPDGSNFAFGSINATGIARIDGKRFDVSTFLISNEPVHLRTSSVSWNKGGTQIVTTNEREGVYIWDAKTLDLVIALFQNDETFVDALFIGEENERVIGLTTEGSIYTLDARTGEVLESTHEDTFLWSLSWNPQHDLLAISGGGNVPNSLSTNGISNDVTGIGFLVLHSLNIE